MIPEFSSILFYPGIRVWNLKYVFFLNIEIDVDSSSLTHLLDSFGVIISLSHRKLVQVDARGNFFRKHWEVLPAQRSLNLHSIQFTLHCIALHCIQITQLNMLLYLVNL